jgi:hypothetical protein
MRRNKTAVDQELPRISRWTQIVHDMHSAGGVLIPISSAMNGFLIGNRPK